MGRIPKAEKLKAYKNDSPASEKSQTEHIQSIVSPHELNREINALYIFNKNNYQHDPEIYLTAEFKSWFNNHIQLGNQKISKHSKIINISIN